jgi:hypothetical protein
MGCLQGKVDGALLSANLQCLDNLLKLTVLPNGDLACGLLIKGDILIWSAKDGYTTNIRFSCGRGVTDITSVSNGNLVCCGLYCDKRGKELQVWNAEGILQSNISVKLTGELAS